MTLALRPALRLYEYTTTDGVRLRVRVSAELAKALADDGEPLKETAFSDLPSAANHRKGLDPDQLDARTAKRRIEQRPMPIGNPWEGPRYHFSLLLGENRPGWLGGACSDARGRCGLCHGHRLPMYAYCLSCQRCGRDKDIPGPDKIATKSPPAKFRPRYKTKMKANR